MSVFVSIKELAFIILSIFFFKPSFAIILIVPNSSVIFGTVCLSEAAVCILLDVINKISFVNITIGVFEDSLSVFLAILEKSFKVVSIAICQSSFSVEITSVKIAFVFIAFLSPLEFDQDSLSIEFSRSEGAIVLSAVFLFELALTFKFIVFEVSSVSSSIWMLELSIS